MKSSKLQAPSSKRQTAGFTMVEIALCLAVIAFALVAIIGVLPIGMGVQKTNREETVINFDAKYLMDTIRSGSLGQDELTNYVVSITNYYQAFKVTAAGNTFITNPLGSQVINWYNSSTNPLTSPNFYSINGKPFPTPILFKGANIIGLLTTPKFTGPIAGPWYTSPNGTTFMSNFITADFRAITGGASDQGNSPAAHEFAFTYRIFPEVIPFSMPDPTMMNSALAANLQAGLSDVRLRYRWPVLPGGVLGNGTQTYRTAVSGLSRQTIDPVSGVPLYYIQGQSYTNAANTNYASLLP